MLSLFFILFKFSFTTNTRHKFSFQFILWKEFVTGFLFWDSFHSQALREHFVQIVVRLVDGALVARGLAGLVRVRLRCAAVASGTKA